MHPSLPTVISQSLYMFNRCSWLCEINTSHRQIRVNAYPQTVNAISSNSNAAFAAVLTARLKTRIFRRVRSKHFHFHVKPASPLPPIAHSFDRYVTTAFWPC